MSKIVSFESEHGEIKVEFSDHRGATRSLEGKEVNAGLFKKSISTLKAVSSEIIGELASIPKMPDELEVKLSLKLSGGVGKVWEFVLASGNTEGAIEVVMKWKKD